jgi:hypothetical protein
MTRSAPFPVITSKNVRQTPEQVEREKARFEEIDARGRLYVTAEEIAAMQRGLAALPREQRTVDLAFGPSGAWLRPNCPNFVTMFNFLSRAWRICNRSVADRIGRLVAGLSPLSLDPLPFLQARVPRRLCGRCRETSGWRRARRSCGIRASAALFVAAICGLWYCFV